MERYKRNADEAPEDKKRQKRGCEQGVQSHFRVTLELRHILMKWFSDADPVGALDCSLLIVAGEHCRLSNIDCSTHTWKEDEEFILKTPNGDVLVKRRAGESSGQHMREWVKLKRECPRLFEDPDLEVMAQPCAVVDSQITKWSLQSMQAHHGPTLWVRDSCGGGEICSR